MFIKFALGVCVSLLAVTLTWAQCGCKSCTENSGACQYSTDNETYVVNPGPGQQTGPYHSVVSDDGRCGRDSDWDADFYDCCKHNLFDSTVCDPCCNRPYVSLFGGATGFESFFRQIDLGANVVEEQGADFVDGYGAGIAVGYRVHHHFRVEAEYSYRLNNAESWFTQQATDGTVTSFAEVPATGRLYSHAGMFNVIYDFSERRIRCANLYAGGGIGVMTIDANITAAGINYVSDDSRFAYQFIGGVNYPLTKRIELFTDYRYIAADAMNLTDATGGVLFGDANFRNHNLFFGIRFNL